jgi:hypothetical protein
MHPCITDAKTDRVAAEIRVLQVRYGVVGT